MFFCDYFEAFFPSWGDFDVIFKVFLFAVFILSKPICFNERGGKYFDTNFDQQKNWALQFEGFHLFITHSMEIYWMKSVIRTHSSLLIFIDDPNKNLFLQTWIKVPLNVLVRPSPPPRSGDVTLYWKSISSYYVPGITNNYGIHRSTSARSLKFETSESYHTK